MTLSATRKIPWLAPGEPFPAINEAWGPDDPAPGLLAAGARLDTPTLCDAYAQGIFPWFSEGQPLLWWSTDPRMVLRPEAFRLHRSFGKTLKKFTHSPTCEVRMDTDFSGVIRACAHSARNEKPGAQAKPPEADEVEENPENSTWIVPAMVSAYEALHHAGFAHSLETWVNGRLVGGLYCVALGRAVFGESMFSRQPDASKIALAGLVAFCKAKGVALIDCQQNTHHLRSLGGREISRTVFANHVALACREAPLTWRFDPVYWDSIFQHGSPAETRQTVLANDKVSR